MSFSKDSITSRHFSKQMLGGLNEFEVRDFLHVLAEEIRHLNQLVENQKCRIREQEEQVQDHRDREHILKRSIVSAQEVADKIQRDTEHQSQMIIARANDKSQALIQEARQSLQTVYNDISNLRRVHLQFKNNLKASLTSQMEILDQSPLFSMSLSGNKDERLEDFSSSKNTDQSPGGKEDISLSFKGPHNKEEDLQPSSGASEQIESLKKSLQSLEKDFL